MTRRPNPFTSLEGCFLSSTVWAFAFMVAFVGGISVGTLLGGPDGATLGGATGAFLVTFTPWRRWMLRGLRRLKRHLESEPGPPGGGPDIRT